MPHAPDLVGCALDARYELLAVIGDGTFGRVYEGRDRRLDRRVAVKVIKPWWAEDSEWAERFQREAQLLARVNDPGIVQIFDFGVAEEGPYYVAELVDGESLAQRLHRGPLPPADALAVAEGLARALASAHARGLVHCDVKPANVLIAPDGKVKVGDFGVARLAEGTSQAPSTNALGTPRYMAPEQARGLPTTPASDVYSAGVVLYEMLAGKPPFLAHSPVELALCHLQDVPPALAADVPAALAAVVEKALAKDPADRFRDGGEMAAALRACSPPGSSPASATAGVARAGTRAGRANGAAAATAVLEPPGAAEPASARTLVAPPPTIKAPPGARGRSSRVGGRRPRGRAPRSRRGALLVAAIAIGAGALAAFLLVSAGAQTTVPELRGLPVGGVTARTMRTHLHPAFSRRYASAAAGIAVAQTPAVGTRVSSGSTVHVVLSAGPPPVKVPDVVGLASPSAERVLSSTGLRYGVRLVAAPGSTANAVLAQSPPAAATAPHGSTVALEVSEPPRWRALTTFTGVDGGESVPVEIRGNRWRVSYSMSYEGPCLLLVICMGPSAQARDLKTGSAFGGFDLAKGSSHAHTFDSGPGLYRVQVSGGNDSARWSMTIQDYY